MNSHANNFNLLRLLAASQVFYVHAGYWLKLPDLGDLPGVGSNMTRFVVAFPGVPIFFVISGFLITQSYFNGSGGLIGYFKRRALRIFPALWTHYIVIFIMLAIAGAWSVGELLKLDMWSWITGAFLIGSDWWGNIFSGYRPFDWNGFYSRFPSGVLWTINVELGFYLLVPLVFASIWRKWKIMWLVMALFAAASLWFAFRVTAMEEAGVRGNIMGFMRNQPAAYFWVFLLGAAAAIHWDRVKGLFVNRVLVWAAMYAALTIADNVLFGSPGVKLTKLGVLTIPRMIVLAGLVLSFAHSALFLGKPFAKTDLSYALYLYHMPIVWTFAGFGVKESWWIWIPVTACVVAASALSWRFIEKPTLRLKTAKMPAFLQKISIPPLRFRQP
ncbi:MAG: acyltransferase [Pseudomonadota bacterium]|nr:acyltransferase [Pseudomonadota bacterium]